MKRVNLFILDGIILFLIYISLFILGFLILKIRFRGILSLIFILIGSLYLVSELYQSINVFFEYYILKQIDYKETVIRSFHLTEKFNIFTKTEYLRVIFEDKNLGSKPYKFINKSNYVFKTGQQVSIKYLRRSRIVIEVRVLKE